MPDSHKKDATHHQNSHPGHHGGSRRSSLQSNYSRSLITRKSSTGSITSVVARSSSGVYYLKPLKKKRTKKEIETFKKDIDIEEHGLDFEELEIRFDTNLEKGLSRAKADDLLVQNGPNCLVPPKQKSKWLILLKFLFGGFSALIWTGSVLSFIEYSITYFHEGVSNMDIIYLAVVLAVEATLTGFFAFYVQQTHSRIMDSFKKMVPKYAIVIRDRERYTIPSEELVLGDLVEINMGDMVPADLRILESHSLKVDNSALTGETNPISRVPEFTHHDPLETMNLAFYGTNVVEGSGMGLVIRCGDDTVLGHIAGLASSIQKDETLLRKELNFFVKVISIVAFLIGLTLFSLSMATGYNFFQSFTFFIAIVVANVPEGLPVAFTVCMTLTAKRMAKKNCLIKKFEILETLGACDIICSDKTGTLTQKIMTASHIYYDGSEYDVLHYKDDVNTESEAYCALCDVAILCSRAVFAKSEVTMTGDPPKSEQSLPKKEVIGDASEAAILRLMDDLYEDIEQRRSACPKVCEIPFTSSNKYQVSIHRLPTGDFLLVMKGAPERVLEHCSTILRDGHILQNNQANTKPTRKALLNLGNHGERVLGFADLYLSPKQYPPEYKFNADKINFPLTGLRFVGLISLIDPPRTEVPGAVAKCKSAGIQVIMITGDHPITATAIARKVGIISPTFTDDHGLNSPKRLSSLAVGMAKDPSAPRLRRESSLAKHKHGAELPAAIISGSELKEMTKVQLVDVLRTHKEVVFARTNPQQKLQIVEALQGLEKVVAVTGDGVNDSPALKQADIGIAMGIAGSDVSKEASDMILLDDNFASIVIGIEEGRLIFDNLKKSIAYELTANIPEIAPFVFLALLKIPRALSIMSILVINVDCLKYGLFKVGTDLWGAISLAYEKPEADIMKRHPRDPKKDKLINRKLVGTSYFQIGVIQTISAFVCYLFILDSYGWHWDKLVGIREKWESKDVNDLEDSYGQEWTYEMRQVLTRKCISAYFLSIVCTQIGDLLRCKTRRLSIVQQGMTNHVLNTGLFFEISLALFFVFCPKLNEVFDFEPINLIAVSPAIPFAILIVLYDEFRKYMIRKYPKKWFYNNTYY